MLQDPLGFLSGKAFRWQRVWFLALAESVTIIENQIWLTGCLCCPFCYFGGGTFSGNAWVENFEKLVWRPGCYGWAKGPLFSQMFSYVIDACTIWCGKCRFLFYAAPPRAFSLTAISSYSVKWVSKPWDSCGHEIQRNSWNLQHVDWILFWCIFRNCNLPEEPTNELHQIVNNGKCSDLIWSYPLCNIFTHARVQTRRIKRTCCIKHIPELFWRAPGPQNKV